MKKEKCELCKEKERKVLLWDYLNWLWLCRECQLSIGLQLGFIENNEVDEIIEFEGNGM